MPPTVSRRTEGFVWLLFHYPKATTITLLLLLAAYALWRALRK